MLDAVDIDRLLPTPQVIDHSALRRSRDGASAHIVTWTPIFENVPAMHLDSQEAELLGYQPLRLADFS